MYRTKLLPGVNGQAGWFLMEADSFSDIVNHVEANKPQWGDSVHGSHGNHRENKKPWHGSNSWGETMRYAREGWAAGRQLMVDALDSTNVVQKAMRHKAEGLDVAGDYPSIPEAVAGIPDCMVAKGLERARTKPCVRILVNGSISAVVSPDVVRTRGAAILSWVDRLESAGLSCEVSIVYTQSVSLDFDGQRVGFTFNNCPVKAPGEVLDIDRAAFMLANPSMYRRIMFATWESVPQLAPMNNQSYGYPSDVMPPGFETPHSVYFPRMYGREPDWQSSAMAVAAVERAILTCLQQSEAEAGLFAQEGGDNE